MNTSDSDHSHAGGCLCNAVRYRFDSPIRHSSICHCSVCRRASAAPAVAWVTVPSALFRFTAGEPRRYASSGHAVRSFCSACGSPLTFESRNSPEWIDITTASLDRPDDFPPTRESWLANKISWSCVNPALEHTSGPGD